MNSLEKISFKGKRQTINKYLRNSPIKWKEIGFVMLPHRLLFDKDLKMSDRMVYWVLLVHQFQGKDYCTPSQALIAEEAGVSLRTITSTIQRLEKTGWIDVVPSPGHVSKYYVRIEKRY